jgi:hypothetical protein
MRALFRWLWRFNALVIAGTGVLALVGIGSYMISTSEFDGAAWNPDQRVLVGESASAPTGALESRMVDGVASPSHVLVAMVSNGVRRYPGVANIRGDVVRNLVLFDRVTGQGRRLFETDAGEVGRMVSVDALCAPMREHNQFGAIVISMGVVDPTGTQTAPQRDTAAVVALWGPPDATTWRLGILTLADGNWRQVASDIERLEDMRGGPDGRCFAVVRRGGTLHSVDFAIDATAPTHDLQLSTPR